MSQKSPRVLVTGGAGYIGSVLVPMLLQRGFAVTVVDNFSFGQSSLLDCCHYEGLQIVRGDVRDKALIKKHLESADIAIPLACLVGAPICAQRPLEAQAINCDAVKMIVDLARPDQRILYPNTNSGYGIGTEGEFCTEESPLNPISIYGSTKVEAENYVLSSGRGLTFRLATVFGVSPRMRIDLLVNDFTYRAVTDRFVILFEAHFKRNYIHVRDVARAFLHALDNWDAMKGEAYNLGLSSANLSKMELCLEIKKQVPEFTIMEAPIGKDPDQRNYIVSNDKIERTGFQPTHLLPWGITELIKGYQAIRRNQYSNV
ncbi:MAG: NAD-dependent epimerase/dehydratase [Kiritimatiellae bacterium]|nr:NAD-dependent epimerase/dehydratase [Kiritimatiellia bacterium]